MKLGQRTFVLTEERLEVAQEEHGGRAERCTRATEDSNAHLFESTEYSQLTFLRWRKLGGGTVFVLRVAPAPQNESVYRNELCESVVTQTIQWSVYCLILSTSASM